MKKRELINNLENAIKEAIEYEKKENKLTTAEAVEELRENRIFEIVDREIPVYTYDILAIAQDDLILATEPSPNSAGTTAVQILIDNIAEMLNEKAEEILNEIENEDEDN